MIQRVKNAIEIRCEYVDFTAATNMEIYVAQCCHFFTYELVAVSEHKAMFRIPKADAMELAPGLAKIQFAITVNDEPIVSEIKSVPVEELLNGDGYGD